MPILADFECKKCKRIEEHYVGAQQKTVKCKCGGMAKKIITLPGVYVNHENPSWMSSVLDVVDKEDKRLMCRSLLSSLPERIINAG